MDCRPYSSGAGVVLRVGRGCCMTWAPPSYFCHLKLPGLQKEAGSLSSENPTEVFCQCLLSGKIAVLLRVLPSRQECLGISELDHKNAECETSASHGRLELSGTQQGHGHLLPLGAHCPGSAHTALPVSNQSCFPSHTGAGGHC